MCHAKVPLGLDRLKHSELNLSSLVILIYLYEAFAKN